MQVTESERRIINRVRLYIAKERNSFHASTFRTVIVVIWIGEGNSCRNDGGGQRDLLSRGVANVINTPIVCNLMALCGFDICSASTPVILCGP